MDDKLVRVAIAGAGGRMGRQLIQTVLKMNDILLGAAIARKGSTLLGADAGELAGTGKTGIIIQNNLKAIKDNFDVFIDFTHPEGTLDHLEFCCQHGKSMVIGTTGLNEAEKATIKAASQKIAIVYTPNFSIGINIMLKLLEKIAKVIGNYTDIEIIEAHHRYKIDAPSGTALAMGETIALAMGKDFKTCAIYMRKGHIGERMPGSIGFATVRAGDIVGEHTVMFAGTGERVEISHKASSLMTFADSAVKAALWLKFKNNGLFDMQDVLNLHEL